MTLRIKLSHLAAGIVAAAMLVGGGYALASTQGGVIHACVNDRTRAVLEQSKCARGYSSLTWNQRGPAGASGRRGATGAAGAAGKGGAAGRAGAAGASGTAATVSVGSVTTGAPGSDATVTNAGTASNARLNFVIPQGPAGQSGSDATNTGPTAYGQVWMGSSAAELAPGNNRNITGVGSAGEGGAVVDVAGCSSAGLAEPVITVTADHDPSDTTLTGADNTPNTAVAWVAHWSTMPDFPVLVVEVETTNPTNGLAYNSDFSITVTC